MNLLKAATLVFALAAMMAVPGAALAAAPANDDFHNAAVYTTRAIVVEGTTVDATKQAGEPDHAGNAGGHSIWYTWTTPVAGRATVSTCGTEFDTLVGVYTGTTVADLDEVAANDDGCGDQSLVSFQAEAGGIYRVAVDGADSASGPVWLSLSVAPPNDDFADAQDLTGDSGSVMGTTVGSSSEAEEPDHYGDGWNSVWYEWTAPSSGWATFETCGTGTPFDTILAAYTGGGLTELVQVAGNDDACGYASRVVFQASAGSVYRIAVAGYEGETGDFTLTWNRNAPAPSLMGVPRVLGVALDGETLTATDGEWSGEPPLTFAYAWGGCDRDGDCGLIAGATSRTLTLSREHIGDRLYVRVTASNGSGSGVAYSNLTPVVQARAPSSVLPPMVTGNARPGGVLVASSGTWGGTTPFTYSYQWQSCDGRGENCTDLAGQSGQVMQLSDSEAGLRIRVVVNATNAAGSASAASDATAVVRRQQTRRCTVPNVKGKTIAAARSAIRARQCSVGRIRRAYSARVKAGRVIGQAPRAGARLRAGAKVNLVLSKGKRR
jgi:PASTA domain